MEESENRKARLKAMRMEAAEAEASHSVGTCTVSTHLSNPLADPSPDLRLQEDSSVAARFDFYTDPMAAFSGERRKSQKVYQNSPNYISPPPSSASPGPGNMNMTPSPHQQYNQSHPSDQRTYGTPMPYQNSGSWRSPVQQLATPAHWNGPGNMNMTPSPHQQYNQSHSSDQRTYGTPMPYQDSGSWRSPVQQLATPADWNGPGNMNMTPSPHQQYNQSHSSDERTYGTPMPHQNSGSWGSPVQQLATPPNWNGPGGTAGHGFPPNSPTVRGFPSPGFGQGGSPGPCSGRGSGYQFSNTPNPSFGRGGSPSPNFTRGSGYNTTPSPSFGQGGSPNLSAGRSSRFNNHPSTTSGGGSPSHNTRRSSGFQFNSSPSPGSGRGRGRGRGFHDDFTARERPDLFYNRSMLEDPWRSLIPVVRKLTVEDESSSTPGSWLPKSISGKKDKTSEAVAGIKSSGLSLAAALAASYEEAAALATSYEEASAANDAKDVSDGL